MYQEKDVKTGSSLPKANPGVSWSWIVSLLAALLKPIIPILSEQVRKMLQDWLYKFYDHAKETDNPWDDFVAELLLKILGFEVK